MTKPTTKSHPSDVFDRKKGLPEPGTLRINQLRIPTTVKPEGKKKAVAIKAERLELYKIWAAIVKARIDFQSLSMAREPGQLFHSCKYFLQADFGTPGHLLVTLYIQRHDPKSPKKSHNDLRRERKIWLVPALETENVNGNEVVVGINIKQDTKHEFAVDSESAFMTIDIETDTVPAQEELDRLFTRKPRKAK